MINIGKYIDALYSNGVILTADEYANQIEYLDQTKNKKCNEILKFIDGANEIEKTYLYLKKHDEADFWEKKKDELNHKYISEGVNNRIRKQIFHKCRFDFETKKKFTPKEYIDFVRTELATIKLRIKENPMYSIADRAENDKSKIDFQQLTELSGLWDFFNYLELEYGIESELKMEIDTKQTKGTKKNVKQTKLTLKPSTMIDIVEISNKLSTIVCITKKQVKELLNPKGFDVFLTPIELKEGTTYIMLAFAFLEMYEAGYIKAYEWKSILEKGKVFKDKNDHILTATQLKTAINATKSKGFSKPKRLFFTVL